MSQAGLEAIVGSRVRLRRSTVADAPVVHLMWRDPDVVRHLDRPAHARLADTEAFLAHRARAWEAGREFHWVVEALDTREPVGCLEARVHCASADLSVLLAPHAWGRGYATDACATLVAAFAARGIVRLWAAIDPENTRAAGALERAGLAREGVLHAATLRPTLGRQPRDTVVHALCIDGAS